MADTWFTVEDQAERLFSEDSIKITFHKDPAVARIWLLSLDQLADLQKAVEQRLRAAGSGHTPPSQ